MKVFFSVLILILYSNISNAQIPIEDQSEIGSSLKITDPASSQKYVNSQFNHILSIDLIPLCGLFSNSPGVGLGYQFITQGHYSICGNLYYRRHVLTDIEVLPKVLPLLS